MNILAKIKFLIEKPKVIVIVGQKRKEIKGKILRVLAGRFKIGKEIFVFEAGEKEINKFNFFLKNSRLPILLASGLDRGFSTKGLPGNIFFVLDSADEKLKEINGFGGFKKIRFGLSERNDVFVSDIKENGGTNFKINYKGSTVPFWLKEKTDKKEMGIVLSAVSLGLALEMNLVGISQALRES